MNDHIQEFGYLALGSRLKRLSELLFEQVLTMYRAEGIELEPRFFPLFALIARHGTQTINEAKAALGVTHAAASQMAAGLKKLAVVEVKDDPEDRRRTLVTLTSRGKRLAVKARPVWAAIEGALKDVASSSQGDLLSEISHFESALNELPLHARGALREKRPPTPLSTIFIQPFSAKYAKDFERLNLAWLKEFDFKVEATDRKYLKNPADAILSKGGKIFFAVESNKVLGTCALIPYEKGIYELAKMSVAPEARGRGIGRLLGEAILNSARDLNAKKVFLETNSKLSPAIKLYESLGFKKVRMENSPYARADVRMQMILT